MLAFKGESPFFIIYDRNEFFNCEREYSLNLHIIFFTKMKVGCNTALCSPGHGIKLPTGIKVHPGAQRWLEPI